MVTVGHYTPGHDDLGSWDSATLYPWLTSWLLECVHTVGIGNYVDIAS